MLGEFAEDDLEVALAALEEEARAKQHGRAGTQAKRGRDHLGRGDDVGAGVALAEIVVRLFRVADAGQEDVIHVHLQQLGDVPVRDFEREAGLAGHGVQALGNNLLVAGRRRHDREAEFLEEGAEERDSTPRT